MGQVSKRSIISHQILRSCLRAGGELMFEMMGGRGGENQEVVGMDASVSSRLARAQERERLAGLAAFDGRTLGCSISSGTKSRLASGPRLQASF